MTRRILESEGCDVFSSGQRRLLSDYADAQADFSLRCVHMSIGTFSYVAIHYIIMKTRLFKYSRLQWLEHLWDHGNYS